MRVQIQRFALFTVLCLNSYQVFAACEDEVQFVLSSRRITVEKPDETQDKDRVRIMPIGQISGGYEVKTQPEDGTTEVRRKKSKDENDNLEPALVERWGARPGNQAFLFDASEQTFLIWVRTVNGGAKIAISKAEKPLEPVYQFILEPGEALIRADFGTAPGEKDTLLLYTEKAVYFVTIDQFGR